MATFAKATFDVAGYLASRPTYPARLYEIIAAYHIQDNTGGVRHALDLGCGPGFMAQALAPRFESTTALDPSPKMVSVGLQPEKGKKIHYAVGSAEDLATVPEQSVDLVVAGQAAHWFDHPRAWGQLARILRPGGTVAYVGYGEMTLPKYPALNALISSYNGGKSALGPYWSQPGRRIVEGLLDAVPFPVEPTITDATLERLSRLPNLFEGGYPVPERIHEPAPVAGSSGWDPQSAVRIKKDSLGRQWTLQRKWGWEALEGYLRSASALHAFHEKHPEDMSKDGDIVDRLIAALKEKVGKDEVDVAWPLVLMMVKKEI